MELSNVSNVNLNEEINHENDNLNPNITHHETAYYPWIKQQTAIIFVILFYALSFLFVVGGNIMAAFTHNSFFYLLIALGALLYVAIPKCFLTVEPKTAYVIFFFGTYVGSLKQNGYYFIILFVCHITSGA